MAAQTCLALFSMHHRVHALQAEWIRITVIFSYLLMKSMQPKARRSDVKRVYEFRESLLLIDLSDPSSELLKGGLLQCAVSPPFLEHDDGIKFLS